MGVARGALFMGGGNVMNKGRRSTRGGMVGFGGLPWGERYSRRQAHEKRPGEQIKANGGAAGAVRCRTAGSLWC